ncbi:MULTISPECIES: hypothetical protein [unclassified Bradyrhizobium]|uniref:hypothetical protein n=1 Tax=unclassified Bradyrhizobium TaxID=2631580 RepID=UPI0028EED302|nr:MULTISPECIES: hypothetical protein [unclassified Bradyrhizobium]
MGSNNASLRNFKAANADLVKNVRKNFHELALAQGAELVGDIKRAIEHNVSGTLQASVRYEDRTNADGSRVTVLVMAGGPTTMKDGFDYALAEEFGTTRQAPKPFFYHTARFYRMGGLPQYRETLDETIKENEIVRRTMQNNNYVMNPDRHNEVVISVGHRGAAKVQTTYKGRQVT